ncbi:transposase [Bacillus sp. FJAT-22090]|uniref:ATP-binding protein n=1 Tax=Bacillus sp. FJAT-22090 TaxID=1581038 RepID=UPI0006ADFAF9|nr:ATP-binding protein [Bacillus sp. FJAT-22090]ALC87388.1 transposase [Bacillus sp. FJAT-22090]
MKKLIKLNNGDYAFSAEYTVQDNTDYQGNPLIEALPPMLSVNEAYSQLSYLPEYNEKERGLSNLHRYHALIRLTRFYQVVDQTLVLENRFSRLLRNGYVYRNPKNKSHAEALVEMHRRLENKEPLGLPPDIRKTASTLSIIGYSGMGKSSAIERILSLYPKVIIHKYPLNIMQVPWLKLNCPNDGSPKTLCLDFITKIDEILGTNYFKQGLKRESLSFLIIYIGQLARTHCLGVLVIDEIQHMLTAKSEVSNSMMNFLVTLVNEIGIPMVLIGTTKAKQLLQVNFRQARRASGHGELIWEQMKMDDNWEVLMKSMWTYQWTEEKVDLTKEWLELMHDESQGIVDIAVKLFLLAQSYAMEEGYKKISPNMINKVSKKYLNSMQPMLKALKEGRLEDIVRYDDITPFDIEDFLLQRETPINMREKITREKEKIAEKRQQKEISVLQKVTLTLMGIEINDKLAEMTAKKVINENKDITIQEAVQLALTIINERKESKKAANNKSKNRRTTNIIFKIVDNGRKERKSAHDSLVENGLMIAPLSDNKLF